MFDFFTQRSRPTHQTLFYVPQPDPFENPLVETDPEQLRQWATALPFADQQQLSDHITTSLGRLNRFPGLVKKRLELMEIYTTPSLRLIHGLSKRKADASIGPIRRVILEMAYGYSHIANECISNKASRKQLDRLGNAIYFAIKYYTLEFLLACEDFDCRSGTAFQHITRLRTFAEEQKIHLNPHDDKDQPLTEFATIAHQYNRFLLLLLLDPCHLQEGEPRLCFDYLNTVAGKARISPPTSESEVIGHYVIDRLGDVSPYLFHQDCLDNLTQPRFCLFDISPVSQHLHQELRQMERTEEGRSDAISNLTKQEATNLLARMLKSWHVRLKRDSKRHKTTGQVMVWIGIQNIHSYITGSDPTTSHNSDEITMTQPTGIQHEEDSSVKHQLVALRINLSRSGVALRLVKSNLNLPLIGELVLISTHQNCVGNEWKIGVIKRAMNYPDNQLEIGLQFILGKIEPITIRSMMQHQSEQQARDYPGIFIDQGHTHRSSLIVPKHFFVLGQEYRVEEMIPGPVITPLQLLETTARFERYRVKNI